MAVDGDAVRAVLDLVDDGVHVPEGADTLSAHVVHLQEEEGVKEGVRE